MSISPPPSKRRRKEANEDQASAAISDDAHIVIYSWNVNGITPFLQPAITTFFDATRNTAGSSSGDRLSTSASLRDVLRKYEWPTMLLLQEVKINPDDIATQRGVQRAVIPAPDEGTGAVSYKAYFSLPSDKYNARGFGRKVYGVCSLIREDFVECYVEKVRQVDWDAEGRFLVCETKARGAVPRLAIFNCYLVNGTDVPYKSETGAVVGNRHDRKLKVHEMLQHEVRTLEGNGFHVVVAGDLNIARSSLDGHPNLRTFPPQHCVNRADFEKRFLSRSEVGEASAEPFQQGASLQMIDSFRYLHPTKKGYTFYPRSKDFGASADRVDMILLSRALESDLTEAGMHETSADRGPSDHIPLFAKLNFK
ncbi:hypothetical protein AC578_8589 [Pseudocercospora eumusae]|uniref:Endonuclease/exonuclease/phosphatase domain-containing protein n=1 Tax=Pseudocercospora eumusae TaxID=321146 RepID=A0A139HVV6_9PEZI|nr:hypothetical protein AC578_8589 [Pseudocercospora eumusae]